MKITTQMVGKRLDIYLNGIYGGKVRQSRCGWKNAAFAFHHQEVSLGDYESVEDAIAAIVHWTKSNVMRAA